MIEIRRGFRWLGMGLLTGAGAIGLSVTTAVNFAFADDVALIMGGTGTPLPSSGWIDFTQSLYLQPNYTGYIPEALFTPEQLYPATGLGTLTLNTSVSQGVNALDDAIRQLVGNGNPDGNSIVVFGASQSAIVASLEMERLVAAGESDLPLHFILVADEIAPNGGLLSRFSGMNLPWLGLVFYNATPDNEFPTDIYTIEYDGFADFPRYPINILSDVNAVMGIFLLHGTYGELTPGQINDAIQLDTEGPTQTVYHMIPTENLPLLEPLRLVPGVGNPLADLLQPDLKVLVNLGYGDPDYGYSTAPANIPTGFGLFPNVDPVTVIDDLFTGARQGVREAAADVTSLMSPVLSQLQDVFTMDPSAVLAMLVDAANNSIDSVGNSISTTVDALRSVVSNTPETLQTLLLIINNLIDNLSTPSIAGIVDNIVGAISTDISAAGALADIVLSLTVSLPTYSIDLFTSNIAEGDLLGAIGDPIAADVGLLSVAATFAIGAVGMGVQASIEAAQSSIEELTGAFS